MQLLEFAMGLRGERWIDQPLRVGDHSRAIPRGGNRDGTASDPGAHPLLDRMVTEGVRRPVRKPGA